MWAHTKSVSFFSALTLPQTGLIFRTLLSECLENPVINTFPTWYKSSSRSAMLKTAYLVQAAIVKVTVGINGCVHCQSFAIQSMQHWGKKESPPKNCPPSQSLVSSTLLFFLSKWAFLFSIHYHNRRVLIRLGKETATNPPSYTLLIVQLYEVNIIVLFVMYLRHAPPALQKQVKGSFESDLSQKLRI